MKRAVLTVFLFSLMGARALGLSMAIQGPQFGFPEGTPKSEWKAFLKFLNEDVTFVKGLLFNEYSTQYYRGRSEKVSELIARLREFNTPLKVRFARFGEPDAHFMLSQVGVRETTLTINLGGKDFNWSGLEIAVVPGRGESTDDVSDRLLNLGPLPSEDSSE